MNDFKKGDILVGTERKRSEAKHFIVFISGSKEIPNGIILTHTPHEDIKCNFKLNDKYRLSNSNNGDSYFVAHLIEKVESWGPYTKINRISKRDLILIESHIKGLNPINWFQYKNYTKKGCPNHLN